MAFLRTRWRYLAGILLIAGSVTAVFHLITAVFGSPPWLVGFVEGAVLASALGSCWFLAYEFDGGKRYRHGIFGEKETASVLQRSTDWTLFHVPFDRIDADVVAVSQSGVFVFESKYTSGKWRVESGRLVGPITNPIPQCQVVARKIRLLLSTARVKVEPTPVLVLWGPHLSPGPNSVDYVDGVQVVLGAAAQDWLPLLEGHPIDRATVAASIEALERYTSTFSPRQATAV